MIMFLDAARTVPDVARVLFMEFSRGPERSGIAQRVTVRGRSVEVAASRGWGVQLERVLPSGEPRLCRLLGSGVSVKAVAAELEALLAE